MKIESVTVRGFRCFGADATTVRLSPGVTALVGANGSGKTALLEALLRAFGITREQRTVRRSDFYVPPGTPQDDRSPRDLAIEIRFGFPELTQAGAPTSAVPPCFQHMIVKEPAGGPFCRARLEARWADDGTLDGSIDQQLYWLATTDEEPAEADKRPFQPHERGLVQVNYVPASRDASKLLSLITGAMAGRLLRAVAWSAETEKSLIEAAQRVRDAFGGEAAVRAINRALTARWRDLYESTVDTDPELHVVGTRLEELVRRVSVAFHPTESGGERDLEALSDGQKSLFYFSMAAAVFDIESALLQAPPACSPTAPSGGGQGSEAGGADAGGTDSTEEAAAALVNAFHAQRLLTPSLTVFALEEPENHLAPFFLSRIIGQVRSLVGSQAAQAVLTSHSPSILRRVDPSEVRYFRIESGPRAALIRGITIPKEPELASKYVREAVLAYPELYFARFVVLAEGDSEQIVLPRLASARGLDVDPAFVAVVPLGGRHVNHLWRLLSELDIPYATLLDLDLGRHGGGWARVKYACDQLLAIGYSKRQILDATRDGSPDAVPGEGFEFLRARDVADTGALQSWVHGLEVFNLFFCWPLDLDLAMLSSFREAYEAIVDTGRGPGSYGEETADGGAALEDAARTVLGDVRGLQAYSGELEEYSRLFPWYRYLFLSRSKPATHLQALPMIGAEALHVSAPPVLAGLLGHVDSELACRKV